VNHDLIQGGHLGAQHHLQRRAGLLPGEAEQLSAQDMIDWAEIYVLDVQPLPRWQRWCFEQVFTGEFFRERA
jgi:hypothetical protein